MHYRVTLTARGAFGEFLLPSRWVKILCIAHSATGRPRTFAPPSLLYRGETRTIHPLSHQKLCTYPFLGVVLRFQVGGKVFTPYARKTNIGAVSITGSLSEHYVCGYTEGGEQTKACRSQAQGSTSWSTLRKGLPGKHSAIYLVSLVVSIDRGNDLRHSVNL